jgi:catecholate siderophore receptor
MSYLLGVRMSTDLANCANRNSPALPAPPSSPRKETVRRFTAALFLAASPLSLALGQSTLPPVNVEATAKKKKATGARKAAPQPPPPAAPAAATEEPPGSYKVEQASSPKMTGPLLDTPQTVTVVPGTIIQERGATNLTEVLKNTPGISFSAGENGFGSSLTNFQIRGFDTTGNVFVDGVRDSGNYTRDTFNVDRVEVVKGAAADNGRGGAGGYVNIVTKTPAFHNFVAGEISIGFDKYNSDIRTRATTDINQRSGGTAVRLNTMIENGGVAGREIAEANAWGVAPSIAFGLGSPFRAIFSYEHLQRNDLPDWGVSAATIPGMVNYNPLAAQAGRDTFYGLRSDFDDVRSDAVTARFEYDLAPGITISNQTRYAQTDRAARYTIPTAFVAPNQVTTQLQYYDRTNDIISNQTNLLGTVIAGGLKHVLSTGLEVSRETSVAGQFGTTTDPGGTKADLFNPDPGRFNGPYLSPVGRNTVEIDTVGAYLYDTIHLNRQWQLVGGLRVDHYSYSVAGVDAPAEDSYTTLGGKIGLVYKPVENGALYISYGRSGLPPGAYLSNADISRSNDSQATPNLVPGADPVEIDNYEAGVKWDFFGGRLTTTAAVFRTEMSSIAYKGNTGLGFPPIVYGTQIVEGVELGIAGNLTERLKVFGGVTWLESERRHGAAVDEAAKLAGGSDYTANPAAGFPGATTTNGDELAFTPNFFANLWLTHAVTEKLTVGGGVRYVGESWLGRPADANRIIPNGRFGKLPDYFVVNFMASYELTPNWDLRFNIDNAFDETYAVSTNWPSTRVFLGDPRTFRLGAAFKY